MSNLKLDLNANMIITLISKRDYYFINGNCGDFDFIGNTQRESQFWKNVKKMN